MDIKRYKYEEWDIIYSSDFSEKTYVDLDGSPITGILEGYWGFTTDTSEDCNCQYIENGRRK